MISLLICISDDILVIVFNVGDVFNKVIIYVQM